MSHFPWAAVLALLASGAPPGAWTNRKPDTIAGSMALRPSGVNWLPAVLEPPQQFAEPTQTVDEDDSVFAEVDRPSHGGSPFDQRCPTVPQRRHCKSLISGEDP